eukprot:jgi/Mesen1/1409/ME000130S00488
MQAIARTSSVACVSGSLLAGESSTKSSARVSFSSFTHNAVATKMPVLRKKGSSCRAVVTAATNPVAAGYAAALAELAKSNNALDAVHNDMEAFSNLLNNDELSSFLENPIILVEQKKAVIKSLVQDGNFNAYTANFLNLLVDKKRIQYAKDVASVFEELYCDATETQVAIVTSAVKLDNAQQALIAKKLQSMTGAKNIKLKNVVDKALIAGFVITYGRDGSSFIDMSVKGQLDRLALQFDFSGDVLPAM